MSALGITRGAAVAIDDMLDNCAKIKAGQEVVVLAHIDGLHGGDNLVDETAISWIQAAVQHRGANTSVLWIDEPAKPHAWRIPPVVKAAMGACDVLINNSFDIVFEELVELKQYQWETKVVLVRNFAVTAPLLCTAWAQTPYELVNEIRYQASIPFQEGLAWQITDDNGTHLEGFINPALHPNHPWFPSYSIRREESNSYRPWPEWVHPPIRLRDVNGIFIFDRMLSWWSRYIGISPYFSKAIRITVENSRITGIEGGDEAEALKRFLVSMHERLGDEVYGFNCLHFGVHPQANVSLQQCPSILYHRLIEHSHSSNIHVHIGAPPPTDAYPYWMHCTGDIKNATFRVGDTLVHDRGHLMALDHPAVIDIAAKYPGRPGLEPVVRSY
ncbi:MAG: M29 family metallopeptidase [Syntrophales bacterium]